MKYILILVFFLPCVLIYSKVLIYTDGWQQSPSHFCNKYTLTEQIDKLKNFCTENGYDREEQVLIGHSMGAVRILGYARDRTKNNDSAKIKGIISLDGEVQGVPCLSVRAYTRLKVNALSWTLTGGAISIIGTCGSLISAASGLSSLSFLPMQISYPRFTDFTPQLAFGTMMVNIVLAIAMGNTIPGVMTGDSDSFSPGIRDLNPDGEFIKKFNPSITLKTAEEGYWTKVKTGEYTETYWDWSVWWWRTRTVPTYLYTYNMTAATYNTNYAIDENIPIAFIAGRKNDLFSWAIYDSTSPSVNNAQLYWDINNTGRYDFSRLKEVKRNWEKRTNTEANAETLRTVFRILTCVYFTGGTVQTCLAFMTWNFCYFIGAGLCFASGAICSDLPGCWGDILGSRDNDSFVPFFAQSSPLTDDGKHYRIGGQPMLMDNPVMGDNELADLGYEASKYNHAYVRSPEDDIEGEIWGQNGLIVKLLSVKNIKVNEYAVKTFTPTD